MSRAANRREHARRVPAILAFGESLNDTKALKELVAALRPDLPPIQPLARPIILRRNADSAKTARRADDIVRLVRAEQVRRRVIGIVVHRDLDDVEPNDHRTEPSAAESHLRASLATLSEMNIQVVVTVPAWETEAWWFMWPEQVARHRRSWRRLRDRIHQRVDRIPNAKEVLIHELEGADSGKIPRYTETDSIFIAAGIRRDNVIRQPRGVSIAFARFATAVDGIQLTGT